MPDLTDQSLLDAETEAHALMNAAAEVETLLAKKLRLTVELEEMRLRWEGACKTVAAMHAAAVGGVRGPARGVVEDVADLRAEVVQLREGIVSANRLSQTFEARAIKAEAALAASREAAKPGAK